jgi:hypothetical protein
MRGVSATSGRPPADRSRAGGRTAIFYRPTFGAKEPHRAPGQAWLKRKEVANRNFRSQPKGESPTGDDARSPRRKRVLRDRRMYTGDRDHEA